MFLRNWTPCAVVGLLVSTALIACEDEATPAPPETSASDAGTTNGADASKAEDAAPAVQDSGTTAVNGCTSFVDRTADGDARELTWDFSIENAPGRCLKVRVGQTVVWNGDLTTHPLNVDGLTPGDLKLGAGSASAVFTKAGTFGYVCIKHPSMKGAVLVVE